METDSFVRVVGEDSNGNLYMSKVAIRASGGCSGYMNSADPELTKDLRDKMVDGCAEMAGDQHFEKMAEDRDRKIVAVLNAIKSS